MAVFLMEPNDLNDPQSVRSTYWGRIRVHAETEEEARGYAALAFDVSSRTLGKGHSPYSVWRDGNRTRIKRAPDSFGKNANGVVETQVGNPKSSWENAEKFDPTEKWALAEDSPNAGTYEHSKSGQWDVERQWKEQLEKRFEPNYARPTTEWPLDTNSDNGQDSLAPADVVLGEPTVGSPEVTQYPSYAFIRRDVVQSIIQDPKIYRAKVKTILAGLDELFGNGSPGKNTPRIQPPFIAANDDDEAELLRQLRLVRQELQRLNDILGSNNLQSTELEKQSNLFGECTGRFFRAYSDKLGSIMATGTGLVILGSLITFGIELGVINPIMLDLLFSEKK